MLVSAQKRHLQVILNRLQLDCQEVTGSHLLREESARTVIISCASEIILFNYLDTPVITAFVHAVYRMAASMVYRRL